MTLTVERWTPAQWEAFLAQPGVRVLARPEVVAHEHEKEIDRTEAR